jgi:glyoxylase-like metal-dependent hydrolase (beta-lactamase superfamily II)
MKRVVVLAAVAGLGTAAIGLAAFRAQQNVAEIEKLRDNLYVIKGGGGNTAAFITEKGVVVVDTKLAGWGQAILDKIKSVTDKPVTTIINTHTHGDHTGSNAEFPPSVDIVAQENTKTNMEKMDAFKGEKAQFLPKRTYTDKMTLLDGKDRIDLYYFGAGHTNGDTIIVFPSLRVAHAGDLFAAKGAPLIDVNNGGSGVAYPNTLAKASAGIHGVETVIPGHSDVTDWKAFQEYADFNRDFLSAVQEAMKAGKSADEAAAVLKLPDRYQGYTLQRAKDNVTKIYAELKR